MLTILICLVVALLGVIAVGLIYGVVGASTGVATLDQPVLETVVRWRTPTMNTLIEGFTDLGGEIGVMIMTAASGLIIAWWRKVLWPLLLIMTGSLGGALITTWAKITTARPRPPTALAVAPIETSYAFPSGHALSAVAVAGIVGYVMWLLVRSPIGRLIWVVGTVAWTVAMGLSRVYLGHHWITDVLADWALGVAWVFLVIAVHQMFLSARMDRDNQFM